jgi:ATP-dependent DNA helicase RecQ
VEALRREGINAMRLDSSMTMEEMKLATSEIVSGRVKVLYITPERFNNEKFRRIIGQRYREGP